MQTAHLYLTHTQNALSLRTLASAGLTALTSARHMSDVLNSKVRLSALSTHRLSVSSHEITIRTRTHTRSLALCTHHSCRQHNKPTPKTLSAAYPGQRAAAKHHPHTSQATHAALVTHLVTHHSTHLNTRTKTPLAVCHEPPASNTPLHKNKPSAFNPDKQNPQASPCAASPLYGLILLKKCPSSLRALDKTSLRFVILCRRRAS